MDSSGLFQTGTQRDDRRRLLLCEPTGTAQAGPVRKRSRRKRPLLGSPHYGDGAFLEHIPRLTDLIPRPIWPYGLALLVGLGIIGGLEWLYADLRPRLTPWTTPGTLETFDLQSKGALAVWFSSTTFLLASGVALIVYLVRRYRRDDYQGRYRIWLWAAGCWGLMSLDNTANLHEGFQEMMVVLTGQRLGGDGSLWWVAACFFLLGGVGVRLLADMRECLLSCTVLVAAGLSYAAAVAVRLQWVPLPTDMQAVMVHQGAAMLGDWLLLLAMALHARHVILDAEGRLAAPGPTASTVLQAPSTTLPSGSPLQACGGGSASSGDSTLAIHAAHGTPAAPAPGLGASAGSGRTPLTGAASPSADGAWWSGANTAGTTPASSGPGSASGSTSGTSLGQTGMSQAGSAATSPGSAGSSPWPSPPRRLTEAEKKALRRKLEKLRKQREAQG
jgi:hypothetical protein